MISHAEKMKNKVEKRVGIDVILTNFSLIIPQSCDNLSSFHLKIDKIDIFNQFTLLDQFLIERKFIVVGNMQLQSRVYSLDQKIPLIDSIASSSPFNLVFIFLNYFSCYYYSIFIYYFYYLFYFNYFYNCLFKIIWLFFFFDFYYLSDIF